MTNQPGRCPVRTYPFGPPNGLDVDPVYGQLRAEEPISRVQMPYGDEAWLLTRYADIQKVLVDTRFSRAETLHRDDPRVNPDLADRGLLSVDPPEHTRLRRIAQAGLTPRNAEKLRPRTAQVAELLVDEMAKLESSPVDIMEVFVEPLAVTVICELLGVPFDDRANFQRWSQAIVSNDHLSSEQVSEYMANLHDYMARLIGARRRSPDDGATVLTVMPRAPRAGASDWVIASTAPLLVTYATSGEPARVTSDEIVTTRPRSAISGNARCTVNSGARTFTAITRSKSVTVRSSIPALSTTAALLMRTSRRGFWPRERSVASNPAISSAGPAGSPRSARSANAVPPPSSIARTVSPAAPASRP